MVWVDQPSASFSRSLRAAVIHSAFEAQVKMTTAARLDYLAEDAQAAAASDGERYLVVWPSLSIFRGDRDILGAAVDADETVQKISIAASPSNESKPAVAALLAGRFVVVYDNGAGTVARIIEFPWPRKRSVR
jgi:hypothetical protein